MSDLPTLGIALLTYRRTDLALRTIRSVLGNMVYDGSTVWYIADDGSGDVHMRLLLEVLGGKLIGFHSERLGPGPSWNRAVAAITDITPYIMWLEDDWELRRPLNVEPYVHLLMENEKVGMVRLGHLPVGLDCKTVGYNGIHYLDIQRTTQYMVSGNPSLRHYRHFAAYGGYPIDARLAGECEIFHDNNARTRYGPSVWWPVDLGGWGIFGHIGEEKADDKPG